MRTPRLLVPGPLAEGERDLDGDGAHHLARVLRRRPGDAVVLFDGDGTSAAAEVLAVDGRRVRLRLDAPYADDVSSPLKTTLLVALLKGDRMDTALQKACELGVDAIHPLVTHRSEVRLDGKRVDNRMRHWSGVLHHATQQSGRARTPLLHAPASLAEVCEAIRADATTSLRVTLDPEGMPLEALDAPGADGVTLATGPEGGFAPEDLERLDAAGFRRWRLGPRVLRAETAPLAALTVLQWRFGDLDGPG